MQIYRNHFLDLVHIDPFRIPPGSSVHYAVEIWSGRLRVNEIPVTGTNEEAYQAARDWVDAQ